MLASVRESNCLQLCHSFAGTSVGSNLAYGHHRFFTSMRHPVALGRAFYFAMTLAIHHLRPSSPSNGGVATFPIGSTLAAAGRVMTATDRFGKRFASAALP